MEAANVDPRHLTRAVAELGRRRPVTVSRAIFNTQGVKIIDAGVQIDERVYERLLQHQLATPIEQSVGTAPSVDAPTLRAAAAALLERDALFARMAATAGARERMLAAVESVPLPAPIVFQLTLMRELYPAQFEHAVACALAAVWLGDAPLVPRHELTLLAAAGMLHDLGMLHVDPVLLQPDLPLTREQRRQLYAHPLVSAIHVERHRHYPQEVVRAVLEHHEALDGSGYPRGLDAATISPWGRVLALAELVAAHLDAPVSPDLRLSLQLRMNRPRFEPALAARLHGVLDLQRAPGADVAPHEASVERLRALQSVLAGWPAALADDTALGEPRRRAARAVGDACAQLLRTLADVGAALPQLDMLQTAKADEAEAGSLALELAMLADEVAWQLRALNRMARRRWRLRDADAFPDALQRWLDDADDAVGVGAAPRD
jgi:hypothetical protein